jgi:hypothetical protein
MTLATHIGAVPQQEYGDPTGEATFHFGLLDAGEWAAHRLPAGSSASSSDT